MFIKSWLIAGASATKTLFNASKVNTILTDGSRLKDINLSASDKQHLSGPDVPYVHSTYNMRTYIFEAAEEF